MQVLVACSEISFHIFFVCMQKMELNSKYDKVILMMELDPNKVKQSVHVM